MQIQTILAEFDKLYITPVTIGILFYYAEKEKLDMKIAEFLVANCNILTMSDSIYKIVKQIYNKKDLEDAMQIAYAKENNIQTVLTLDSEMAKKYGEMIDFVAV